MSTPPVQNHREIAQSVLQDLRQNQAQLEDKELPAGRSQESSRDSYSGRKHRHGSRRRAEKNDTLGVTAREACHADVDGLIEAAGISKEEQEVGEKMEAYRQENPKATHEEALQAVAKGNVKGGVSNKAKKLAAGMLKNGGVISFVTDADQDGYQDIRTFGFDPLLDGEGGDYAAVSLLDYGRDGLGTKDKGQDVDAALATVRHEHSDGSATRYSAGFDQHVDSDGDGSRDDAAFFADQEEYRPNGTLQSSDRTTAYDHDSDGTLDELVLEHDEHNNNGVRTYGSRTTGYFDPNGDLRAATDVTLRNPDGDTDPKTGEEDWDERDVSAALFDENGNLDAGVTQSSVDENDNGRFDPDETTTTEW